MSRCPACPGVNTCIPLDRCNDYGSAALFVGEAPGRDENKRGVVFVGKTGDEVNRHYLPLAGMRRESTPFINAIKCLPTSAGGKLDLKRSKDRDLLQSCAEHFLYREIEELRPRVLVPMGALACYAIDPAIDLDRMHGFPIQTKRGVAFPMHHPAYGIHEPKKMLHIRTDWQRLRQYLGGTLQVMVDEYPEPDYKEVLDEVELGSLFLDLQEPLACDTESTKRLGPFCITFSQEPGTGRLIRVSRKDLLSAFGEWVAHVHRGPILFHNWLYDWPVTEALGLKIPPKLVVDTMARVFHLGNLPQGLKALAWRELGMEMMDYDDLVTPHSAPLVVEYYEKARHIQWPKPEEQTYQDKAGEWKLKRPQSMTTKLKRFFTDLGKDLDKDVFSMWDNWEESHSMIEERMGPWPGKCISHVPFEEALYYACRDADALLRLWPVLKRMSANVRHSSQEWWRK